MEMFLFILTNSKLCSDMFGWFKEHYCFWFKKLHYF